MLDRLCGGHGDDRHLQTAADGVSDFSHRHALFGDRVDTGLRLVPFSSTSL